MYKIALLSKETVADGTMLFILKTCQFKYQAGQSLDMTLVEPKETDAEGILVPSLSPLPSGRFPCHSDCMRDTAFKRTLHDMVPNTEVAIQGPFGSFFLHENTKRPAVFLSGGIGITPFRAIIKDTTERLLPHTLLLFYSNRRPEDAPF